MRDVTIIPSRGDAYLVTNPGGIHWSRVRDPLEIPRPDWCPQCGADYRIAEAICEACGYDATGEFVIYSVPTTPQAKWRQIALWLGGGVVLAGILPLSILLSVRAVNLTVSLIAVFAFVPAMILFAKAIQAAISLRVTRRSLEQIRFGPLGWAQRVRVGKVKWNRWPHWIEIYVVRPRRGVVGLKITDGKSQPQFPKWVGNSFQVPRGGVLTLVRRVRAIHRQATDLALPPRIDHISYCPQCSYWLDVPDNLPRPGNCPECGWRFEHDTLLLDGLAGSTYHARRPESQNRLSYLEATLPRTLRRVGMAGLLITVFFFPQVFRHVLPGSIWGRIGPGFFIALLVVINITRSISRRIATRSHDPAQDIGPGRWGDQFLWLDREGFAQRQVSQPDLEDGRLVQHLWTQYTWRVTHIDSVTRLLAEPKLAGRFRRWRLRRSLRSSNPSAPLRRMDFVIPSDRDFARELRAHLRAWPQAQETPRHRRKTP